MSEEMPTEEQIKKAKKSIAKRMELWKRVEKGDIEALIDLGVLFLGQGSKEEIEEVKAKYPEIIFDGLS